MVWAGGMPVLSFEMKFSHMPNFFVDPDPLKDPKVEPLNNPLGSPMSQWSQFGGFHFLDP